MATSSAIGARRDPEDADAWKVLQRVADAFDNPGSLTKVDKDVLFVVNVVRSRQLSTSCSSVCPDGSWDSSLDSSFDEDLEVVELGDVSGWAHDSSYPYAPRGHRSPRGFSDAMFRKDDGMYDVTKMLLTSSPLDRLDRLARMELKKTGWFERQDKWSVMEMGLQVVPLPTTPARRKGTRGRKAPTPCKEDSPGDSYLGEVSTLSYGGSRKNTTASRVSGLRSQQGRGGFGQVVRDFVRRMLPVDRGRQTTPGSNLKWGSWSSEHDQRWSGFWQ